MRADFRINGQRFFVRTPYSPVVNQAFHLISGRRFEGPTKEWSFPLDRDAILGVCDAIGIIPSFLPADLHRLVRSPMESVRKIEELDASALDNYHWIVEPYEHQRKNILRLIHHDRWLLADEMGLGKTACVVIRLTSIMHLHSRVLILCPKSVVSVWQDELQKHAGIKSEIIESRADPRLLALGGNTSGIFIANYELLLSKAALGHFDVLVIDEVHRVKNFTAKTSKRVQDLSERAKHVYALSGTPAPNGLQDWHGVLAAINPDLLPVKTKTAFEARYVVKRRLQEGAGPWVICGYRNVAELHEHVASVTSRNLKADCLDLPEKIYSRRVVRLEGEQARIYRDLKRDAVARIKDAKENARQKFVAACGSSSDPVWRRPDTPEHAEAKIAAEQLGDNMRTLTIENVLTESLRLLQVIGGFVPDDDGKLHELDDKAKIEALRDVLNESHGRQAVIWCNFVAEVDFLVEWLQKQTKLVAAGFTGDTSGPERASIIESFRAGSIDYFVGTAGAGGAGINGLQVADLEIYYSRGWSLTDYLQSQDRLHRIGQRNAVNVVKLIAGGTVDERVDEALEKKASMQEMMLRDPEQVL